MKGLDLKTEFRPYNRMRTQSSFLGEMMREKCIDYSNFFNNEISENILNETFEEAPKFRDVEFKSASVQIIKVFDETDITELVLKPPKVISAFIEYINSLIPSTDLAVMLNSWQPCFPQSVSTSNLAIKMLILLLRQSCFPEKIIMWMTTCLFPVYWDKKTKPQLKAASLCVTTDKSVQWAVLTQENVFMIYNAEPKQEFKILMHKPATKATFMNRKVRVYGKKGTEIASFEPLDPNVAKLWQTLFEKKAPHILDFMTKYSERMPNDVIASVYKVIMARDAHLSKILFSPDFNSKEELTRMLTSAFELAVYGNKVVLFTNQFLSIAFSQPQATIDFLAGENSTLHYLYREYIVRYAGSYFNSFTSRLIIYLNANSNMSIVENPERVEILFFTSLKLILDSIAYIPPEIRLLAAMIKNYAIVKFNNKSCAFKLLADFFANCVICPFIARPGNYIKGAEYSYPFVPTFISNLLANAFTLSSFAKEFPEYDYFEKRLRIHFHTKIRDFINGLGDLKQGIDWNTIFGKSTTDKMVTATQTISHYIAKKHKSFTSEMKQILHPKHMSTSSALGWAVACGTSMFFCDAGAAPQSPTLRRNDSAFIKSTTKEDILDDALPTVDTMTIDADNIQNNGTTTNTTHTVDDSEEDYSYSRKETKKHGIYPSSEFTYTYDSNVTHDAGDTVAESSTIESVSSRYSAFMPRKPKMADNMSTRSIKEISVPPTPTVRNIDNEYEEVETLSSMSAKERSTAHDSLVTETFTEFPSIEGETIESYSYTLSEDEATTKGVDTTVTTDIDMIKQETMSDSFSSVRKVKEESKYKPAEEESITSYNLSGDEKLYSKTRSSRSGTSTWTYDEDSKKSKKSEKKFKVRKIPESVLNSD